MENNTFAKHPTFYAVGLSYKKADAEMRGKFSLDDKAKQNLLHQAKEEGLESLVVTSTCNRTEIYGFAQHPFQLIKLLCENSQGTVEDFQKVAFVYKNNEAISHMFRVGTGLDSQILGDFEIISQLKNAFVKSKELELANAFLERLVNAVIQASKKIKNETEISSGATSVSFASVQYIFKNIADIASKNILAAIASLFVLSPDCKSLIHCFNLIDASSFLTVRYSIVLLSSPRRAASINASLYIRL